MFQMHRVFFATPWELEGERYAFYDIVGKFNEEHAIGQGILFVPVTLVNIRDKRPVQYAIEENIRECRCYLLALSEDWGPVERNFENDYLLAQQCASDASLPMKDVALIRKIPLSGRPLAAGIPEPKAAFSSPAEFDQCVTALLSEWFSSIEHGNHATA